LVSLEADITTCSDDYREYKQFGKGSATPITTLYPKMAFSCGVEGVTLKGPNAKCLTALAQIGDFSDRCDSEPEDGGSPCNGCTGAWEAIQNDLVSLEADITTCSDDYREYKQFGKGSATPITTLYPMMATACGISVNGAQAKSKNKQSKENGGVVAAVVLAVILLPVAGVFMYTKMSKTRSQSSSTYDRHSGADTFSNPLAGTSDTRSIEI
jgi:hypothetical protein